MHGKFDSAVFQSVGCSRAPDRETCKTQENVVMK